MLTKPSFGRLEGRHRRTRGTRGTIGGIQAFGIIDEEDDSLSHPVHYGDLITIFDQNHRGYMTNTVSSSADALLTVASEEIVNRKDPRLGNVKSAVYQIVPLLKFKSLKTLLVEIKKHKRPTDINMTYEKAFERCKDPDRLELLKELADAEKEDNESEIERRRGDAVNYGATILLYHVQSKRFVRVISTVTSRTEASSVSVDLCAFPERNTWLKVIPRFKVRTIGDPVRYVDQVIFESLKTTGQYLHVSATPIPANETSGGSFEVNCAITPSTFSMYEFAPHNNCVREHQPNTLLFGGEIIQLVHKEINAYMAAEGVFTAETPTEDIHLRFRPVNPRKRKSRLHATTAITFFQIEIVGHAANGSPILWGEQIRIKHVGTRKYLAFKHGGNVASTASPTLVNDKNDPECIFSFHPVTRLRDEVELGNYARIFHHSSNCWLTSLEDIKYIRQGRKIAHPPTASKSLIENTKSIQWDGKRLCQLGLSSERKFNDAFIVQTVAQKQVDDVAFVQGIVPILKHFTTVRLHEYCDVSLALSTRTALEELNSFLFHNGLPQRLRQKLLRSLGVIEVIIDLLKSPFAPFNTSAYMQEMEHFESVYTRDVLNAAFVVLHSYSLGESRKNELYLASHMPFFHSMRKCNGVKLYKMFTELIVDNHTLVSCITTKEIQDIVDMLQVVKAPAFLKFLGALCVCEQAPIPQNQSAVCDLLLHKSDGCVFLTDIDPKTNWVMVRTSPEARPIPMKTFAETGMLDEENQSQEFNFLEEQIELFQHLTFCRNEYCRSVIVDEKKYVTWEECFICMTSNNLPMALRAMYVELLTSIFVDHGENYDALYAVDLAYEWNSLTEHPYHHAELNNTEAITGATFPQFDTLSLWIADYLKTQDSLVVANKDANFFLKTVLDLLYVLVSFGYYVSPKVLKSLIEPLKDVLYGRTDYNKKREENEVTRHWRQKERFERSAGGSIIALCREKIINILSDILNLSFQAQLQNILIDFKCLYEGNETTKSFESHGRMLRKLLACPDDELYKFTDRVRAYIADVAEKSNWLTPHWHPISGDECQLVSSLLDVMQYKYSNLLGTSMFLLHRIYSARNDLLSFGVQTQVIVSEESKRIQSQLNEIVPLLRRLGLGYIEEDEVESFLSITTELEVMCYMETTHEGQEMTSQPPHKINQTLIFNMGVTDTLFHVLSLADQPCSVLNSVFNLLRALAVDNSPVQHEIYDNFDLMLVQTKTNGWQNAMAFALAEAFTGNHKLCLAVTESELKQLMTLLEQETINSPMLLILLEAILKAENLDLPLRRNQTMVVKFLLESRSIIIDPAYIDDEGSSVINEKRINLLHSSHPVGSDGYKLREYHINLVSLLASCAEGENKYIESMCQTIFSVDELIEVLADPFIEIHAKGVYIQFFLWVYLNTSELSDDMVDAALPTNVEFWNAVKVIAEAEIFNDIAHDSTKLSHKDKDFLTLDFVPFISKLIRSYFSVDGCKEASEALHMLAPVVTNVTKIIIEHVSNHAIVKKAIFCVMNIAKVAPGEMNRKDLEMFGTILQEQEASEATMECIIQYNAKYKKETEINDAFDEFSRKLQQAYQGLPTMKAQLAIHGRSKFDEPHKKYFHFPARALPLFPEFQQQLCLFVEYGEEHDKKVPVAFKSNIDLLKRTLHINIEDSDDDEEGLSLEHHDQVQLYSRTMMLLRGILHNRFVHDLEATEFQNEYKTLVEPIMYFITSKNELEAHQAFVLFDACLLNGNKSLQDATHAFFTENRFSAFFENCQHRITTTTDSMVELRSLRHQVEEEQKNTTQLMGTMTLMGQLGDVTPSTIRKKNRSKEVAETSFRDEVRKKKMEAGREKVLKELAFTDDENVALLLAIIQNMCEGYNFKMKQYFLHQADNVVSIDVVTDVTKFFQSAIEEINDTTIELLLQSIESLVELCQGCPENQRAVFDAHILDTINDLLRVPSFHLKDYEAAKLLFGCAKLILAMVEDAGERTKQLAIQVADRLDIKRVVAAMEKYYKIHEKNEDDSWFNGDDDEEEDKLDALEVSFSFFHIIHRLSFFDGIDYFGSPEYFVDPIIKKGKVKCAAAEDLKKKSCSVEIIRDDQIQTILFYNHYYKDLRDSDKDEIIWNVDRSSPADKLRDFVAMSSTIIADFKYVLYLKQLSVLILYLFRFEWLLQYAMIFLTCILNVLMLYYWRAPNSAVLPVTSKTFDDLLPILGPIHIVFTAFVMISYFLLNPVDAHSTLESLPFIGNHLSQLLPIARTKRTKRSLLNAYSLHHILLVPTSVCGMLYSGYFYFYPLFQIVIGNDILIRVLQAITKNGRSLLWIGCLLCLLIYTFTFISFGFMNRYFDQQEGYWCNSLWQCFITSVNFGLRDGVIFPGGESETYSRFFGKSVFDTAFFIIINTIGLNVVFGIIVDAFAALRDEKYFIEEAMANECFICSHRSYDLERFGSGFHHHIKHEHNMWDYVYFFLYLNEKNENDYTNHESYVHECLINNEELLMFPIGKASCMQGKADEQDKINALEEQMVMMQRKLDIILAAVGDDVNQPQQPQPSNA
eukprot:m.77659 g.77659  ORF g.77659 m.77659 type:complete len:2539 (+) comp8548_c0_seq6:41-7657(+)